MASCMFDKGIRYMLDSGLDWDDTSDTSVVCMLVLGTYTPDETDEFASEISASYECDATNYVPGFGGDGREHVLSGGHTPDVTESGGYITFDATDFTWTSLGGTTNNTLGGAAILDEVTNDGASPLIVWVEYGDKATDGSDFTLQWHSNGIFRVDNTAA